MERIRQKLHSRRGVSILLALLLMLVAAMVSVVIVGASLTAAKRVNDDRAQEQAALSISSAAKVMVEYLNDKNTYEYVHSVYEDGSYDPPEITIPNELLQTITEKLDQTQFLTVSVPTGDGLSTVIMAFTLTEKESNSNPSYIQFSITGISSDQAGTIFLADSIPASLDDPDVLNTCIEKSAQKLYLHGTLEKDLTYETTKKLSDEEDPDNPGEYKEIPGIITSTSWRLLDDLHLSRSSRIDR